jgi:hypothetical protein
MPDITRRDRNPFCCGSVAFGRVEDGLHGAAISRSLGEKRVILYACK